MDKRRLGSSDLMLSQVGLGCNNFGVTVDQAGANAVVDAALEVGINFFDTADVYGGGKSEGILSTALGKRRGQAIVTTKFGLQMPGGKGGSRAWIMQAAEDSLKRLNTDYIDLYQMHRPDPETPIEETLRALEDLVAQGKVRWIGCSGYTPAQMLQADGAARSGGVSRFISDQDNYSLLARDVEAGILPTCERLDLGFLPYFPLASGLLTGKYRRGEPPPKGARLDTWGGKWREALNERNFDLIDRLTAFAEGHGHSLLELAMGWLLAKPVVGSVIAGATRPDQVKANAAASGWKLTAQEAAAVDALALQEA
jgi:aryl-alcohol dehydrogenase-like predicted oxidoreductase